MPHAGCMQRLPHLPGLEAQLRIEWRIGQRARHARPVDEQQILCAAGAAVKGVAGRCAVHVHSRHPPHSSSAAAPGCLLAPLLPWLCPVRMG